jgi:5-methylcytosine-specific restriction enzyme subunit McrC
MRTLTLYEHGVLRPAREGEEASDRGPWERVVPARWYERLYRLDGARGEAARAFRWEHGRARAQQWVGVIQLDDITLEVLPKVERIDQDGQTVEGVRGNLLWFLSVSGAVPMRERDLAHLAARRAPLLEALAAVFAGRLRDELLQGPARAYVTREENLRRFKGRLLVPAQVAHNAAHRERFYCRFDELSEDTALNRVLRAACAKLARRTSRPETQDALLRCLEELDGVASLDAASARHLAGRVTLDRRSERFRDVFTFARLVLDDESPEPVAGARGTFTLLFDMNKVFERFVARFLRRRVLPILPGWTLTLEAEDDPRWLLDSEAGKGSGIVPLSPDLLLKRNDGQHVVIDTKWKAIQPRNAPKGKRPPSDDFYQLHAYAHRYGGELNILLHPKSRADVWENFRLLDHEGKPGRRVCVRTIDLHADFTRADARDALVEELRRIVCGEDKKAQTG